ncbi:hypothetical protein DP176_02900 [Polynucleobacter paneuropaeus]|jgi:hypothetical protein|uniref:Fucosyltransferase C-terminal domain-containing protein n=1 Tax=Polynucleobacter paneuropaeus TaxID=2527775 RepID=A0ABX9FCE9_9BURK|nr:glycosyltransferase family 10 [Polynucleobacter paneuropaeus]MBT8520009.1 hypothetical protein [Polynucleobacter paneuropaeus]QWD18340.1 hypothetical protein G6696_01615 [Polynucleobacter paneuropaeus]RAZ43930.1 hypothetical protein DP176_02900 [Polynucleobacter paneuropaeus]
MKFAVCSNNAVFNQNRLQDPNWCRRFPGSGWVSYVYQHAKENNIQITSGDLAIDLVSSGEWRADEIFVISEMNARDARILVQLGAKPFIVSCFEAPLYAPIFYDNLERHLKNYRYKWVFGLNKAQMDQAESKELISIKFPSYFFDDLQNIENWESRKCMALVAENKYKTPKMFLPTIFSIKILLRYCKYCLLRLSSPSYAYSIKNSLHDRRLELIEHFMKKGKLDLYGSGWNDLSNLPKKLGSRLSSLMKGRYFGRCENKLVTLGQYQFSICFENMALKGYMTEKIIDCFVAGTIPIYLGDPLIQTELPRDSFIDTRDFESLDELDEHIQSISKDRAIKMIESGRAYLQSPKGSLHSYEGFAKNVIKLAQQW